MADVRFNAEALIAEFGDETLIADLAKLLLEQAGAQLNAVHEAIAQGNAAGLKSAAHKIKGGIGTLGPASLARLAMALELIGRDGRLQEAAPLAALLDLEVQALCGEARAWLTRRAA